MCYLIFPKNWRVKSMLTDNIQKVMHAVHFGQQAIEESQLNANRQQMQVAQQKLEQASKSLLQAKSRYETQLNAEQIQLLQQTQQQLTHAETLLRQNQIYFNPS